MFLLVYPVAVGALGILRAVAPELCFDSFQAAAIVAMFADVSPKEGAEAIVAL